MEVHFTPEQEAQVSQIGSHAGADTERLVKDAAENWLAGAWENSLTRGGQFELVGVLRLRNRSAARSSCSAQDDKIFQFRGNTVSATVPW